MNRRDFLRGAALMGAAGAVAPVRAAKTPCGEADRPFSYDGKVVRIPFPGVKGELRAWVVGDTHFGLHDARDDAYADNYKRDRKSVV